MVKNIAATILVTAIFESNDIILPVEWRSQKQLLVQGK
jgi:hypothetical protein